MAVFNWDPALYDIGVQAMNLQHQGLIKLMNTIHDRNSAGAGKDELGRLLGQLASLTTRHFADEEKYMESVKFPDLKAHQLIHAKLLRDFTAHVQKFSEGNGTLGADFFNFLSLWLRAHIQHIDMRYGSKFKVAV